jgi:hypothetical protein
MAQIARPFMPPSRSELAADQRRSVIRAVTGIAFSSEDRSGEQYVSAAWPSDDTAQMIARTAVAPMTIGSSGLPGIVAINILPSIAPKSAAQRLFSKCMRVNLDHINQVFVPRGLPVVTPIFVSEGAPSPVIKLNFKSGVIGPTRKILVNTAVTRELEEATPEIASDVIGALLSEAATRSLDAIVFDNNPDDGIPPAGLLNGLTPIGASTGTGNAGIAADLGSLAAAVAVNAVDPDDMIIITNPKQAVQIRYLAGPAFDASRVFGSVAVPDKRVIGIAPAAVASGYSGIPAIEKKRNPSIQFEDTNPAQIVDAAGNPAAPVQSVFQVDMIAIRVRCWAAWNVVAAGGVSYIDNVAW